ncbi:MAG: ribosome biogenesis GTPase Der [bacterium]|nr:ribosome biogenesis GTPase Der [bacterium]
MLDSLLKNGYNEKLRVNKIVVSIIGKPNVGKSTLFNLLVNKGIAVTSETEGTTRDILIKKTKFKELEFIFIDTGGLLKNETDIDISVNSKIIDAIKNSDIVLFVVDNNSYFNQLEEELLNILRKSFSKNINNKTILVINKSESKQENPEYYSLGLNDVLKISCKTKMNIDELKFKIYEKSIKLIENDLLNKESKYRDYQEEGVKISFVGRPNVGKSSLINAILNDDRVIVSDIAGTTRDSIDIPFKFEDSNFILIDTPGVRRKSNISSKLEAYSITRSIGTIKYSDIVILVIDISEGLTRQDKRLAFQIYKHLKPAIILANKFDLLIDNYRNNFKNKIDNNFIENLKYELADSIREQLYLINYAPIYFVSAKTKYQLDNILYAIKSIKTELERDFSQYNLLEIFQNMLLSVPLPYIVESKGNKKQKKIKFKIYDVIYYKEDIPTFKVVNNFDFKEIPESFKNYLKNNLSKILNINNIPIKLLFSRKLS